VTLRWVGSLARVRPIAVYTAARLAVFVVLAAALYLLGMRGLLLFAAAILLSMPLSYVLLGRQLAGVTDWLQQRRTDKADLRARLREDGEPPTSED
jgi:Protein of unknown function (DUF4229)